MDIERLVNKGIIAKTRIAVDGLQCNEPSGRTVIVTGIARSGTSLISALLKEAGLFMGEFLHDVVYEDAQVLELLRTRDMDVLKQLINDRNREYPQWGFKIPDLHAYLRHDELALFRNPHLIVIYRDPVAVAVRNALSEYFEEIDTLARAASAMHALAEFIRRVNCPVMLLSYEKALSLPTTMIEAVLEFCGIAMEEEKRAGLSLLAQPNSKRYLAAATASFEGRIDGVLDGRLYGWCRQVGRLEPVHLEIHADGKLLATVVADAFREDLANAAIGNGCHGFYLPLAEYGLQPETLVGVRIRDRVLELKNSGRPLGSFPNLTFDA